MFVMALVVVVMILAGQYESWIDPIAVVTIVPLAVLGAIIGLAIRGLDLSMYTQVGLILLVGLSAKNAILVVEFAREEQAKGKSALEAAVDGARLRFRAIIMTSFAFIVGVFPLVVATEAGAASRQAVGTAVCFGMLGVTMLGIFFTPPMYAHPQRFKRPRADDRDPRPVTRSPALPSNAISLPKNGTKISGRSQMFSRFFVERPILASVISLLIMVAGGVAIFAMPISQFPPIAPPMVQVTTSYPGADPKVVADTVAASLEQQVNGVENMLYMSSTSARDGSYTLKITFELGTDVDMATVLVQTRLNWAMASLPQDVQRQGVNTKKASTSFVTVLSVYSPDGTYDDLFLTNYVTTTIKDQLADFGASGRGDVPSKDYSMRLWLNPNRLQYTSLTTTDVVNALRIRMSRWLPGVWGRNRLRRGRSSISPSIPWGV